MARWIAALGLALAAALLPAAAVAQAPIVPDPAVETARLEDLTSIRQIKHLQAHWGHLALRGQWADMAALLTDDVVIAFPEGELTGRDVVAADLREVQGGGQQGMAAGRMNLRLWITPVITLDADGQGATGRWQEIALAATAGQQARWEGGTWVVRYVRQDGTWRIARMQSYPQFAGDYGAGWRHDAASLVRAPYHFTPAQAGRLLPLRRAALALPMDRIAAEASLLYEHGRVQNLVNAFGFYLDRGMYDDVADLFYADARLVVQGQGTWTGLAGVRRFLGSFGPPGLSHGEMNDHLQLMPKVILSRDGLVASVSLVELGMAGQHGGEGEWSATLNHFVAMRDYEERWRISSLYRIPIMRSTYAAAWAAPLDALPVLPEGAEPDRDQPARSMSYPQASVTQPISDNGIFAPAVAASQPPLVPQALDRAEAFDAAENVTSAYAAYINRFSWAEMARLFAPDGWREVPFVGVVAGRDRILQAALARYGASGPGHPPATFQAIHMLAQPYASVSADGTRVQLRNRLIQMNSSSSGTGSWLAGIYEWQLERHDGAWLLAGMDLDYTWIAGYREGWTGADPALADALRPAPGLLSAVPLAAPIRGAAGVPFPAIESLPFHYANPVSGRPPERRIGWTAISGLACQGC